MASIHPRGIWRPNCKTEKCLRTDIISHTDSRCRKAPCYEVKYSPIKYGQLCSSVVSLHPLIPAFEVILVINLSTFKLIYEYLMKIGENLSETFTDYEKYSLSHRPLNIPNRGDVDARCKTIKYFLKIFNANLNSLNCWPPPAESDNCTCNNF